MAHPVPPSMQRDSEGGGSGQGGVETRKYKRQGLYVWDRRDLFTLEIVTTESQIDTGNG